MKRTPLARKSQLKRKAPIRKRGPLTGQTTKVRVKRGPRSRAMAPLDRTFSRYIRDRDQTCQFRIASTCSGVAEQCCHLIGRGHQHVRWDPENAVGGCRSCHVYFTLHPHLFGLWCVDRLGLEGFKALVARSEVHGSVNLVQAKLDLEALVLASTHDPE